ncbi:hypothetical protein KKG52_00670 [Patescibacteria group bacterium]|nr:hypothetical protein [Patescibacteria group bacterium]
MTEKYPRIIVERPILISLGRRIKPFSETQEYLKPLPITEPNNELLWRALGYNGMDGYVKAKAVDVFHAGWEEIRNADMPLGPVNITTVADDNKAEIQETPLTLGMGFNIKNLLQLEDIRMLECEVILGDNRYYLSWSSAEEILETNERLGVGNYGHMYKELRSAQGNIVLLPLDLSKLSGQISIEVVPAMETFEKKFGHIFNLKRLQ